MYDGLIIIKVHEETINNTFVHNFAVAKPDMTIGNVTHITGCIVDMEESSCVAEFFYHTSCAAFSDEEEK